MSKKKSEPKTGAKTKKARRFPRIPAPFVGLGVMVVILLLFNAQLITGQLMIKFQPPVEVQAIEVPPKSDSPKKKSNVPKNPLVIMPNAGIKAPVVYGMSSILESDVQNALQNGVLHFGGSPLPGESGNSIFVGHSSGPPWAPGDYKFVFTTLNKMEKGNQVQLAYKGELYVYEVTGKKIVSPTDVSILEQTGEATATFITCWPVGTNAQRIAVKAKLVSHDPRPSTSGAQGAPELNGGLPGNSYSPTRALQEQFR
jgi:sortase A